MPPKVVFCESWSVGAHEPVPRIFYTWMTTVWGVNVQILALKNIKQTFGPSVRDKRVVISGVQNDRHVPCRCVRCELRQERHRSNVQTVRFHDMPKSNSLILTRHLQRRNVHVMRAIRGLKDKAYWGRRPR